MKPDAVLKDLQKKLGANILEARIAEHAEGGKKKHVAKSIWVKVGKSAFKDAVAELCKMHPNIYFAVISGCQEGDIVELNYHFSFNYAEPGEEFFVTLKVALPKSGLSLPTITNLVPGALISERETQEMFGVRIEGIPDPRRIFLDDGFPQGVFPWRRDETGPQKLVKKINEADE
ncbi:MAG: NADH-quinone oxidoreductase subunit C [Candidatus Diapherotrites archaeon]|nr:NADH-quinone oxidoreductase subunit C [Candidatus Diapherotrites archaeon]